MADDRFERIVRSPLEYQFGTDKQGAYAQQVVKELEGKSNLLMDATYMPTSEDTRHRGRRNEELRETAVTVASDEGHVFSEGTHEVEYTTEIGMIADGCKFNEIQEKNAQAQAVAERNRLDISSAIESVNRLDAKLTVYGNTQDWNNGVADPRAWNGFGYYTRKITDRTKFERNYYAGINPFEAKDLCLTLDNQAGAEKKLTTTQEAAAAFGSIYAVVWGTNFVSKLYPKNSMTMGIDTKVSQPATVLFESKDRGIKEWMEERYIAFEKSSGVNVHDRFGLIRVANICFTGNLDHDNEELDRLIANMGFVEEVLAKKGITSQVKFYAPTPLIRKMREVRAKNGNQKNVVYNIAGIDNYGQKFGIMAENFYLNDNYLLTPEFQMTITEKMVH